MTGSTLLLLLLVGRRTALRDRILAQASTGVSELGSVTGVIRRVAIFTLIAELAGAILLTVAFLFGDQAADPIQAVWWGIFHSISAFNNGGFDLFGGYRSLADFVGEPLVLSTIGVLIVLGGLGFAIVGDIAAKRRWRRLALETGSSSSPRWRSSRSGPHRSPSSSGPIPPPLARCRRVRGRSTRCSRPRPFGLPASAPSRPSSCATRPSSSSWR